MTAQERMIRMFDRALVSGYYQEFFEGGGYFNFGYWSDGAKNPRSASDALLDNLIERIDSKSGRILDVACGPGGSTERLTRSYLPENITAVNISEAQLQAARRRAPGCNFLRMDAARLEFPDQHVDAVLCVEAALNFDTRDRFLCEAM